jgi:DNA-binding CsgD family transcriptional regulator
VFADAVDAVLTATGQHRSTRRTGPSGLTPREIEVLSLIARGASTRQVAHALGITAKTAGTHIERIYTKTGASTPICFNTKKLSHESLIDGAELQAQSRCGHGSATTAPPPSATDQPGWPGAGADPVPDSRRARSASHRNGWAVGDASDGSKDQALVLHWNGRKWARVASPGPGAQNTLLGVAAASAGDAWAVGSFRTSGPGQALALHCC